MAPHEGLPAGAEIFAAWPALYAVVDVEACDRAGHRPLDIAHAFLDGGVRLIQVRAKSSGTAALRDLCASVVAAAAGRATVVVNDRADVAAVTGAAGVHVGQDDLSPADARLVVGATSVVGLSTHTLEQAAAALDQPVSYIAVGPIFATASKDTGYAPVGLELVRAVAALTRPRRLPLVAIGGITADSALEVLAAGASSVCVISDLLAGDPRANATRFVARLRSVERQGGAFGPT